MSLLTAEKKDHVARCPARGGEEGQNCPGQKCPKHQLVLFNFIDGIGPNMDLLKFSNVITRSLFVAGTSPDLWNRNLMKAKSGQNYQKHQLVLRSTSWCFWILLLFQIPCDYIEAILRCN